MAFQNITNLNYGLLLQTIFSNGILNQLSTDHYDWELIKSKKVGSSVARQIEFMLQTSVGPSAIQYRNPGQTNRDFPTASQSSVGTYNAYFKEIEATIELEYNVWSRANQSPEKYGEPLAIEIEGKSSASKRRLAADLYGDGTGVVGTVASSSIVSGKLVVVLSTVNAARGNIGMMEEGDLIKHYELDGTVGAAVTVTTGTFSHFRVESKNRSTSAVTLTAINTAGADTPVTAFTAVAGEVMYRTGQPTIPDLTSVADYGTVTETIAGLESLVANDGRVIHGMTMSGALGGSRYDAGAGPLDVKHIQRGMSQVKTAVGKDRYKWKMMNMAPESLDALIEGRETDRRFVTIEDATRGASKFCYQHQGDTLECYTSEYIPQKRIYIIPEAKGGDKVLEFHGSEFQTVKAAGGQDFQLKPSANGGFSNMVVSYLQAIGVIICKHPKAILTIENFTNS